MPENWTAGSEVRIAVPNSAAICVRVKAEITQPVTRGRGDIEERAEREAGEAPFQRNAEEEHRHEQTESGN